MMTRDFRTDKNDNPGIETIIDIFQKTFSDKTFSRSEKRAVREILSKDYLLDKDERALVRSRIFDMAREAVGSGNDRWVLDWLETANKLLLNRQDSHVFFSPGNDCRDAIVDCLEKATKAVDICVYTISDNVIADEIMKCKQRNIDVRIITDDDKVNDRGSDIWEMAVKGIQTKLNNSPHYMHHKFALFDHERVLTGSYNWTRSAAECNQENVLITDDKRVVVPYIQEFEKLWDSMEFIKLPGRR
jgi:phosphatidylserine/phosphatidylglycerophosphate/cardiolipin synthase-like enzyme